MSENNENKRYSDAILHACRVGLQTEECVQYIEEALEAAPERASDILRVAKGLRALTETTAGKSYLAELEKKVEKSPQ